MARSIYVARDPLVFGGVDYPEEEARYRVVGVPYDATSSFRPGSREAPRSIRWAAANIEFYSPRARLDIDRVAIHDYGDVAVVVDPPETLERVRRVVADIVSAGDVVPVVLGGEHTITYGVAAALPKPLCMVVMDAHLDARDEYLGHRYSHASFARRLVEDGVVAPSNMLYIGARAYVEEEARFVEAHGVSVIEALELLRGRVAPEEAATAIELEGCRHLHVSIDMDVFDPSYAPGVGNPEPEGLTPTAVFDALHALATRAVEAGIGVSLDVVEVSPPFDCSGVTSVLAAKTVVEFVAAVEAASRRGGG